MSAGPHDDPARAAQLRAAVVAGCRALRASGLTHGTSGNVSVRCDAHSCFVSPTGIDYERLAAEDVPRLHFEGRWYGGRRPSSEWRLHRDIYRARPELGAIVHAHARHATALACTARGIPAFHYMVAVAGGADIRCAPYRTFGTQALSDVTLEALADRKACLLANHGLVATGVDLDAALKLAGEIENLAAQYLDAVRAFGAAGVQLLDPGEMARVLEKFRTYGRADAAEPGLEAG